MPLPHHVTAHSPLAQRSTRLAFLIAGFSGAAWAPLIPYARLRCHLDDGHLGLLLLCLGLGSIIAMPLAGALAGRYGCRWLIALAVLVVSLTLPVLALSSSAPVLVVALVLFGAGVGAIDCLVNVQALSVERACARPMMSGFHGLFSIGGLLGALGMSAWLSLGVAPFASACIASALILLTGAFTLPGLLTAPTKTGGGAAFALPRGIVLVIGLLCFIVFLAEGAAIDWSAVFLTSVRHINVQYAGLGYAAFASTMTLGRLSGDWLSRHVSGRFLITAGSFLASAGMFLVTILPYWFTLFAGYAMVGAGCANVAPVLYRAVGRQQHMPEHLAVSAITTIGYSGILLGPALLGFIAHITSLAMALSVVGGLLLGAAIMGALLPRPIINGR